MKGRYLFFAACLGCLAFVGAQADDDASVARAAARRVSGNTNTATNQTRQKNSGNDTATRPTAVVGRNTNASTKSTTNAGRTIGARTAVVYDSNRTSDDTATTSRITVAPRNTQTTGVLQRTQNTASRGTVATISRSAIQARGTGTPAGRTPTGGRTATSSRARAAASTTLARAAANNDLRDAIMGRDYKSCRQVYYECMDEFCANKDSQLKRCACSSRLHEFDKVKQQLANVEDKLLDFNQRLLTVNMDKEDAAALNIATEGELAFNQKDTSASKKILDQISKKLNSNSDDSFNQSLSAISLSLNADAAFDSIDSLMGASTTTKEGVELYNAALPICREMAAEVCDNDSLSLAESGYQMTIEQDCNTIAKTYETQIDQARDKIHEGSALLDISRLDIYQKRNSDDILTCKKKMLTQLYDTSVCGDSLGKCLDISGQYIDPSTGQAFLTQNLANLSTLITRPTGDQTWTDAPGNDRFISYLNSKKKYLSPAMENCQDIADYVWDEFIDDALSQIKLAQDKKLEEVRQSCTTLTAECLSETYTSISDFDARALSTFGVMADKTVNEMCSGVRNACTALLETVGGDQDWIGGMTAIATDKTYETIMHTCREVGRACIIQACKSISGNFGMCESVQNSVNRKSIINQTSCWPEVKQCVASAGETAINNIFGQITTDADASFYTELYGSYEWTKYAPGKSNCHTISLTEDKDDGVSVPKTEAEAPHCIYDICANDCYTSTQSFDCRVCRLAEKIWGNCEAAPTANIKSQGSHNRILIPKDNATSTLLSWFAQNTGTDKINDSCRDTSCPAGYNAQQNGNNGDIVCINSIDFDSYENYCPSNYPQIQPYPGKNLCCKDNNDTKGTKNNRSNCCIGSWESKSNQIYGDPTSSGAILCYPNDKHFFFVVGNIDLDGKNYALACVSDSENALSGTDKTDEYPNGKTIQCNGTYVYVDVDGRHIDPNDKSTFMTAQSGCNFTNGQWTGCDGTDPSHWIVNLGTK